MAAGSAIVAVVAIAFGYRHLKSSRRTNLSNVDIDEEDNVSRQLHMEEIASVQTVKGRA